MSERRQFYSKKKEKENAAILKFQHLPEYLVARVTRPFHQAKYAPNGNTKNQELISTDASVRE
ncbi:hypothetical protein T4B_5496 [Trichinella pseudospiralis]|uniref:Uncharacterized protein n=1 Tax=Trichinella pseudospiralis TaxID=6337 RepID=A0A0V1JGB3_TRIPS|nr:hypothetical protein T4B_5496 [Trichinella pseudospiralis]